MTYQSLQARDWRRRWYRLQPQEILLFHAREVCPAEAGVHSCNQDAFPAGKISLHAGSSVATEYPESQAEGSFKITAVGDHSTLR